MSLPLLPGPFLLKGFPRFGLGRFARKVPSDPARVNLEIGGDVNARVRISDELGQMPRAERNADFHRVTSWSVQGLA